MSDQVFAKINEWIVSCCRNHSFCHPGEDALLPRFVIEIHGSDRKKPSLQLFENDTLQNKKGRYIALSYVWGIRPQPVQLMKGNLEQLKESIDYDCVPGTIQDAIRVAQRLGVKYVWVDALCIVQDDDIIKKQQIGQMQNIYGQSYLTLQAANVMTVKESFLKLRKSPNSFKLRYDDSSHVYLRGYTPSRVPGGSARQRGWVFQETVLSSRLLVYGEQQIIFHCREELRYEEGVRANQMESLFSASPFFLRPGDYRNYFRNMLTRFNPGPNRRLDFLCAWYGALDNAYTTRMLTYPGDRLPALSGVVVRFQKEIGGRYVAGIWESDLPWGLLWESKNLGPHPPHQAVWRMSRPANPSAPSWSWVAMNGATKHYFWKRHNDTREEDSLVASVCMKSLQADMIGEIVNGDGMLQIGGPLIYTSVICKTNPRHKTLGSHGLDVSGRPNRPGLEPYLAWDSPEKRSCETGIFDVHIGPSQGNDEWPIAVARFDVDDEKNAFSSVWCLLVCRSSALMLVCVDQEKRIFRRLGIARVSSGWPYDVNEQVWTEVFLV